MGGGGWTEPQVIHDFHYLERGRLRAVVSDISQKRGRYPDFLHAAPCDNHACGFRKSGVRGTRSLVAGKVRRAFFFTLDVASHLLAMPNFL
jgi:hypothetical protein